MYSIVRSLGCSSVALVRMAVNKSAKTDCDFFGLLTGENDCDEGCKDLLSNHSHQYQ
jgi:hypothetical protein